MPWPFFIPEFLKRRACRYLLHYYLGQFLEEKLSLEDLTIDLYNGTGSVSNVPLNVETINEVLEEASAPIEVVEGYIGCISISVPWSSLMSSSCKVEISGLSIAVTPSYTQYNGNVSMTDSLFFNMSRSRQLAEEVLKAPPTSNEQDKDELEMSGFEGMEILAKAIEAILLRIQVSLVDTTVNICQHSPRNGMDSITSHKHELGLHISRIEFFDELTQTEDVKEDGSATEEEAHLPEVGEFATKVLRLSGLTLELSNATSNTEGKGDDTDNNYSVPIACASGEVDVKVKIKQSDTVPGPKLDIQVLLESIHMLLYPQQLHTLVELVNGITSKYNKLNSTVAEQTHETAQAGSHYPGLSRPIPKRDMRTIENQLVNHIDIQRKKKMEEEELLQLDPWNIAAKEMRNRDGLMTESTHSCSASDMFYSFDLQQNTEDSISNQSIKGTAQRISDARIQDGVGLEQLLPPSPKLRPSPHPMVEEQCIYSIAIGGVTCAILENNPVHTHIVRSSGRRGSNDADNDGSETDSYSSAKADSYFRTDTDPHSLGSTSELCSLDEGGLDPFKYLDCVRDVLRGRVGPREIKSCENKLGQILPADHIFLWMSTVNAKVVTEGVSTSVSLTVVSAELQEYLYHNEASLPLITPVSIQSLIQFLEDPSNHDPCLSLQVSSKSMPSPSAKLKSSKLKCPSSVPTTDIDLSLSGLHVYLDVTIIDRLHTLLHPQPVHSSSSNISLTQSTFGAGNTLFYPTVNAGSHGNQKKFVSQVLFSEAMSPSSGSNNTLKVSVKVAIKTIDASLRFPVADLSESVRPPWYRPPLRTEVLFLEFLDVSLFTSFVTPSSAMKSITGSTSFETAKVYFSLDGSHENRQLFAVFDSYSDPDYPKSKQLDKPSIKLMYQILEESPLDRPSSRGNGMGTGIGMGLRIDESDDDEDEYGVDGSTSVEPSPFSQRNEKILFSPDKGNRLSVETGSRQIILPASPDEMDQFQSHLSSTSNFSLSVSIPSVSIHIPNKVFLETLFNRISMDLLLWQPGSPADMEKAAARSIFYSSADILQPAMTKEDKFKLCKSVLRESSHEENCTDSFTFSSFLSPTHSDPPKAPTFMMTSLMIDRGTISLVLPIKTVGVSSSANAPPTTGSRSSPGPHLLDLSPRRLPNSSSIDDPSEKGLVVIKTRGCRVCAGINYEGEPERTQICCQFDELNVHHCGCLPHSPSLLVDSESLLLDINGVPLNDFLIPWSYMNSDSDFSGRGLNRGRDPVLSLSMDSRTEKDANRRIHKVAVQLSGVLLNYTQCLTQHTLFHQCGEFFQLDTMAVPGYDPPTVITELYVDLKQSGLQYRPLHLPFHGVLTFEDLSLSTTLVTDSPLLVIDLLIDQMRLFVSNKQQKLNDICLKRDFVCVVELLIFQVALRLCNKADMSFEASKLFSHIPEVDLQCSGSELHMMFCVDSCSIFRDLIIYLAENGDLKNRRTSDTTVPLLTVDTPIQEEKEAESKATKPHPPPVMVSSTIGDLISEAMDDNEGDHVMTASTSSYTSSSRGSRSGTTPISPTVGTSPVRSTTNESHAYPHIATNTMTFSSDSEPDLSTIPSTTGRIKQQIEQAMADEDWEIDEDDYCVLAPPTTTRVGPSAEPGVKCLLNEDDGDSPFTLVDNYYQVPDVQIDQLKRPKHFPNPVTSYSLRELTIVWHLYGGWDFGAQAPPSNPSTPSSVTSNASSSPVLKKHKVLAGSTGGASEDQVAFHKRTGGSQHSWIRRGGSNRDHDVLMEFELDKLRLQYESYPEGVEQFSRIVLLIRDLEIRDRLAVSRINKFLYHYTTEARPRQNHANMVTFKVLFTHPDSHSQPASVDSFQSLEATVRVSMLPLRLNIDQDSFFFLYEFFNNLLPQSACNNTPDNVTPSTANGTVLPSTDHSTNTVSHHETPPTSYDTSSSRNGDVFIKSFVFYPDVTIRVDYEAKRFHSKQLSALTGMLLGLSHLDNSEVTLKALTYKNGVLGWNQLFEQVMSEWVQDIQRYQLPRILQGVGPVYHVTQLFQGALNLFWMPVQQYQEDGRILWGIQRGANSFVSSSGVAVVELSNRMLQSVESLAQTAFDIVNTKERRQLTSNQAQETPPTHQPADLREGIANAYNVVSTGIGSTAWDLYDAASTEHNEYGVTGAVGGVLKNIPGTIVRPIIFMSEATRHVLGGMKNQFVPEARKEATDKWKST